MRRTSHNTAAWADTRALSRPDRHPKEAMPCPCSLMLTVHDGVRPGTCAPAPQRTHQHPAPACTPVPAHARPPARAHAHVGQLAHAHGGQRMARLSAHACGGQDADRVPMQVRTAECARTVDSAP
ncbi:hypothetical protein GGX14DRAFT_700561, partial [Mycena pura]